MLDTESYRLELAGRPVSIEPLVFDLLAYLVEHRNRVVSRDELLENLWKGKVVTDAALGTRLRDVRKAVGDNGARQAIVRTVHGRGYRFIAEVEVSADGSPGLRGTASGAGIGLDDQGPIRFCRSSDGVSIAHARVGEGFPVFVTGSWMTHLEEDWKNPGWGPYLSHLARSFELIRYDQRGNGLSDWDDVEISFERMVDDLAAVIDSYDHDRFAIFGCSQAAAVSIAYAVANPARVSHLILHGGYARGRRRRGDPESAAESEALVTLMRQGWGNDNPAIRQTITSLMMPDASPDEARWFNEFQRTCGPAENIARFREMFDQMDVAERLEKVAAPALVTHSTGDSVAPLAEGKLLASRIPGARFVTFNSKNHMIFGSEPEFSRLMKCIEDFLRSPAA